MAEKIIKNAPMEERDKQIIINQEQSIVKLMDPDPMCIRLMQRGVIDDTDRRQILRPESISEKNKLLLTKLPVRGPAAFNDFMECLDETGTDNHMELLRILRGEDTASGFLPVDHKLDASRQKRVREKLSDHEERLKTLETQPHKAKSEDDAKFLKEELMRTKSELGELQRKLETQDGKLKEVKKENRALRGHIQTLKERIETLQTTLQSEIESKENKAKAEMNQQLQDYHNELEEIKKMVQDQIKLAQDSTMGAGSLQKSSSTPRRSSVTSTKSTRKGDQQTIVPRNRFQDDKPTKLPPVTAQDDQTTKRPLPTPGRLPPAKPGKKGSK